MNQFKQTSPALSWVLTGILILLSATLQTTIIRGIEVFHVIPNLLLIIVICYGLLHDDYSSLVVGVVCGLILDLFGSRTPGINTLLCVFASCFCMSISDNLFNHNVIVSMVFVMLLTIPFELITYIFYFVIWGKGNIWYAIICKMLPAAIYNFLFTLIMHPIVKAITYQE